METIELVVPGMTCGHCEAAVRGEVGKVAGVSEIDVDLVTKHVRVTGESLTRSLVIAAIDEAGFDVAG